MEGVSLLPILSFLGFNKQNWGNPFSSSHIPQAVILSCCESWRDLDSCQCSDGGALRCGWKWLKGKSIHPEPVPPSRLASYSKTYVVVLWALASQPRQAELLFCISHTAGSLLLQSVLPLLRDFLSSSSWGEGTFIVHFKLNFRSQGVTNILFIAQFCECDNPDPNNVAISFLLLSFPFILRKQKNLLHFGGLCLVFCLFSLSLASSELHWWSWKTTTEISQSTTRPY